MSVLILHRGPLASAPYHEWLADYPGPVLLLASREQLDLYGEDLPRSARYAHLEALTGYDVDGRVEARALDLAREYEVELIIACQERDLERAAQLREILDLPGQRLSSAVPFRDKVRMKELLRAAGVAVAPSADVESAVDLIAFADRHGFPLVLKPRNGGGSIGLRILNGPSELDDFLQDGFDCYGPDIPNLMAEAFVPGPMCHVDGLVVDGRIAFAWPSQYLYSLSSFAEDRGARVDITLDPRDPLVPRLLDFTDRVLDVLPGPADFAFHAEVFHTPDDELVLCEIACRTGGAGIRDVQRTIFGVDPTEYWVRAQVGLPLPALTGPGRLEPTTMAGQLLLMKRPGRVLSVPDHPGLPWIERYRLFVQPGQDVAGATFSGDFMAAFIGTGPSRDLCERRLRELGDWFLQHTRIAALPAAGG